MSIPLPFKVPSTLQSLSCRPRFKDPITVSILFRYSTTNALTNVAYHFNGVADFNAEGKPDIILRNYTMRFRM